MQLIADNREGVHNQEVKIDFVDKNVAMKWLVKLDGSQHTLLSFKREDDWSLMIGGGPIQYIITLGDGTNDFTFHTPSGKGEEMVELCAGGQFGEFPQSICATKHQAAQVIADFFDGKENKGSWL